MRAAGSEKPVVSIESAIAACTAVVVVANLSQVVGACAPRPYSSSKDELTVMVESRSASVA